MRCSSAGSICHSPFSSLATEIFPALIARRIAVLFRPTAAAAVAMVYMGMLPTVSVSRYGATAQVKKTCMGAAPRSSAPTVSRRRAQAVILKSETYHFHRLNLTRQSGFIVTIYDEDGPRLAATMPCPTPAGAFAEARKIVNNKVEGPRK